MPGQHLDLSQVEVGMMLAGVPMLDYQVNGRRYERIGNHSRWPAVAPHNVYRCAGDDHWIALAAETDEQWRALCETLGGAALASDPRFVTNDARIANQDALDVAIEACTRDREPHELMYALQARGVPAGVAQTTADKMERDAQLADRQFYRRADSPELGVHAFEGLPMRFSAMEWEVRRGGPAIGEHTDEVLTGLLGYSVEEVAAMRAEAAL
jgi:crotonobetainyl-CoA:carnitine CoA-transferase CaiB-like acyl-CoA transferase